MLLQAKINSEVQDSLKLVLEYAKGNHDPARIKIFLFKKKERKKLDSF